MQQVYQPSSQVQVMVNQQPLKIPNGIFKILQDT